MVISIVVLLFLCTGCAHLPGKQDGAELTRDISPIERSSTERAQDIFSNKQSSLKATRDRAVDLAAFFNLGLRRITTVGGTVVTVQEPASGFTFPLVFTIYNKQMPQGDVDLYAFLLLKNDVLWIARRDDTLEYMAHKIFAPDKPLMKYPVFVEWRAGERYVPYTTISLKTTSLKPDAFSEVLKKQITEHGIKAFLFGAGPAGALQKGDLSQLNVVVFNFK